MRTLPAALSGALLGLLVFGSPAVEISARVHGAVPDDPAADAKEGVNEVADKPDVTELPDVPRKIQDALQSRKFADAVNLIDAELKKKPKTAAYLLYLKGRAQTELQIYDRALETFSQIEIDHADGPWVSRARFGKADVFARRRDYRSAGVIYRAEAERLLSAGRRDELVAIYLEFADRYFEGVPAKGPTEAKKPDYTQALAYYQEALKLRPGLARRQHIELRIARSHLELKQFPQAIQSYQQFLTKYVPDKDAPGRIKPDDRAPAELEVQARYRLGAAQLAAGQHADARRTWRDFLSDEQTKAAGGDLVAQATFKIAHTYGVPAPPNVAQLELGVAAAEAFLQEFPDHKLAPQAELQIAQSYIHHGRHDQAVERLKNLITKIDYAGTPQVAAARRMLGQSYFAQKKFDQAVAAWKAFLDNHPTNPQWSEVQRLVINAEYQAAEEQRQERKYAQARKLWETFLNKYPLDSRAPQILFHFGGMKFAAAVRQRADRLKEAGDPKPGEQSPVLAADVKRLFEEAVADWRRLVSKYPGTQQASHASYMIGVTLEDHLARLEDALAAYKKVEGPYKNKSQQRIARLTSRRLEVVTERKFRSNEKPHVRLTTRNIETLTVKVHRVDMLDYFRKMHLATGVETLDTALIDPDKTWEYKVENYEKYRRLSNEIEISVDGPGVSAVTISGEKFEATTMVIVSDLDLIVKGLRNELFVFVQNMRTGKPAAGVSLLVSDGEQVFAEEVTGEDGVFQKSYDKLKTAADLRVFAVQEGHAASSIAGLDGLDFAVGLAAKGYLYTDRSAYRAGQLVNIKGVVRQVEGDRYTFKPGEKYKLDVYDSRGRVIRSADVVLGKFGTFADNLELPDTAPQGQYRVHLHQPGRSQSYETAFQVHEFKLEPVEIVVDVPRDVWYRGGTITGTITLRYYYGTPLADRTLTYGIQGQRTHTANTSDKGEIKFEFDTTRYNESQTLQLQVQYPERGIATSKTLYLATRGIAVDVQTLRNVYITGETFDATVNVADPAGEPVETKLKLEVFERTVVDGKVGERKVATHELTSDKEDGDAHKTLSIEDPGVYYLRASGKDRFDNTVSGQKIVRISGKDDKIRLRILADRHHYEVGDEAAVRLHWREDPALALVTYEGATILGYRLVELKTGSNNLAVPLEAKLAPNFVLSVAVMDGNRFHQAQSEFRVERKLNIVLEPSKTTLEPGGELKVDVTVTDAQGKPAAAELSLALIQQNLLDRFGENQPAINAFFAGGYRRPSVRVATSATFRYAPTTREISQYLLAEAERRQILEMELNSRRNLQDLASLSDRDAAGVVVSGIADALDDAREKSERYLDKATEELGEALSDESVRFAPAGSEFSRRQAGQMEDFTVNGPGSGIMPGLPADGPVDGKMLFGAGGGEYGGREEDKKRLNFENRFGRPARAGDLSEHTIRNLSTNADPQSGPFSGGGGFGFGSGGQKAPSGASQNQKRISGDDLFNNWSGVKDGSGQIADFETTLSLVIKQNQEVLNDLSKVDGTILAVTNGGELQVVNGLPVATLNALAKDGLRVLPGQGASETGYWNPAVLTDDDGKTTVTFRLPERSTAWSLLAKGVTQNTLTGQADVKITAKKDLFGELKTPLAFTTGDKAQILVEVHNQTVKKGEKITVTLKTKIGDRTTSLEKTIDSDGPGLKEVAFPVEITTGDEAQFTLNVAAGELKDERVALVPVEPYGLPVFATTSGTAAQSTLAFVQHDKDQPVENPQLEIVVGPSVNRTLVDAVIGANYFTCGISQALPPSGIERAVSDALGGVALLSSIRDARNADTPEAQALAGRVTSAVSQLTSSQRDDGGWSWSGRPDAKQSDRFLSSRVAWALAAARTGGFAVPNETFEKATAYLRTEFTKSRQSDREGQAILLHGLSAAGTGDFAFANRLYRERNSLSPSGLVHLALALSALDRKEMARDILELVHLPVEPATAQSFEQRAVKNVVPWMQGGVELRALWLLALEDVKPTDANTPKLADWLMAARRGMRWQPEKANGPAVMALAKWRSRTKQIDEKYTLNVFVNDRQVEKIEVDPAKDASRRIAVDSKLLEDKKPQRINFDMTGRGRFSYTVVLSGSVPADKIKSTTNDWRVKRTYEPAQRTLDGQPIPRGFDVLNGGYKSFKNPLTQLPMGERGEVTLSPRRYNVSSREQPVDYLVMVEPIPAGTMVLPDSVTGSFERYEIGAGEITFYIGDDPYPGDVRYTLVGYLPGDYRAAPTVVRSFYRPELIAVAEPKSLDVLARGAETNDKYRLTPTELYHFGVKFAQKREFAKAAEHLTDLFRNWRLDDNIYKETVQTLFTASLALEQDARIVEFFEIIKEKYPEVEIDFDSILKVAASYQKLGEYERSYLVYRATLEAAFQRESRIAGFLTARGEFLRAVEVMERLLRQYPAEGYIATARYSLAGEVYAKAANAADDQKLRDVKITRVDLIAASIRMQDHFLSTWPMDPAADEAAFAIANSLLDLEKYEAVIARCRAYAERYPESDLLDSFWYVIGFSQFALGKHEEALEMSKKVADATRKDPATGVEVAAANKWQAIYIMGQIYHSLGQPANAVAEYERVDERFPDAEQAIEYFTHKQIGLPEVSTIKPGDKAEVTLDYRNVPDANVKVYRIDLMKFGLMQRNLDRITAINLAGIRPYHELTLELGDGKDFRDREKTLELPLKEEGAYLVVCRGGNLYASGLVLITPLDLELQEDAVSGRVRVTVKNQVKDAYAAGVHVKVIGSANEKFNAGETDLRGIFIADAVRGTATVIARAEENRYAFYRGKTHLGQPEQPKPNAPAEPQGEAAPQTDGEAGKDGLLDNLRMQNGIFNRAQRSQYKELLDNKSEGVKAKKAF